MLSQAEDQVVHFHASLSHLVYFLSVFVCLMVVFTLSLLAVCNCSIGEKTFAAQLKKDGLTVLVRNVLG